MDNLLLDEYTKRSFIYHMKPGCLFYTNKWFLKYLRTEKNSDFQYFKGKYYKFHTIELKSYSENDFFTLLFIGKQISKNFYDEYVFLYKKEKLFLYQEDIDYIEKIKIKII